MSDPFYLKFEDDHYSGDWHHINGETLNENLELHADVVIIGSGAGGGISAEALTEAGFKVIVVEEGPLRTAKDFKMEESIAYPDLYQEAAARKTADQAINILQGRAVGGSTTVNWTSSFRTPEATLSYWQHEFQIQGLQRAQLDPYFDWVEQRLNMQPWAAEPNTNNALLAKGCEQLHWRYDVIARNVRGCANLGYCGMGCPMNAKQSMLTTCIPAAMSRGASLISRLRIDYLQIRDHKIVAAVGHARDSYGQIRSNISVRLHARHFVLAAGAIGTPALMLRSQLPDPHLHIGKRTFLHPVVISTGLFEEEVKAWSGAPQSIYSDQFTFAGGVAGPIGYKLEVPPIHPLLVSTLWLQHGDLHRQFMQQLPHAQAVLALMRDGFHGLSEGGSVALDSHHDPVLHYPLNDYIWDGVRRALLSMAELQFAAGASKVMPLHMDAKECTSWTKARVVIHALPMRVHRQQLFSAHVMGGAAMGADPQHGVTDNQGRVNGLTNLSVHDGSLFPTSLGVNPQLTIYALARKFSEQLISDLA